MKPIRWNLRKVATYGALGGLFIGIFQEQEVM